MAASSSLYRCLYLTSSASQELIHETYEQAVLFWSEKPDGAEHLKRLQSAYEILSDPMRRVAYDTYGLSSILEDESSYQESTPRSTPPPTPLTTHTPATNNPTVKHSARRVTFLLPNKEERKEERREKRRAFEPEEGKRRKRDSLSKSKRKDKTEKYRDGSTVSKDHKSSSKGRQNKEKSSSSSTSRDREKTSNTESNKERAHRKLKCTSSPPRGCLHASIL